MSTAPVPIPAKVPRCRRCDGTGYTRWSLIFEERVYCGDCRMGLDVARADQALQVEAERARRREAS